MVLTPVLEEQEYGYIIQFIVFTDKERLKKQQIIKKDSKEARNNDSKPTSVGEGQQDLNK